MSVNQTLEPPNDYTLQVSQSQIVPLDIISIIRKKKQQKSPELNEYIYVNPVQESSKIIDSSKQQNDHLLRCPELKSRISFKSIGCICRICDFPEYSENPLLRMCRCFRSKKYVHEYCLKKQIIEQYKSKITNAKCEICNQQYQMELKIERSFQPRIAWKQSKDKLPLMCLVVFLVVMIVIVILLGSRIEDIDNTTNSQYFLDSKSFLIIFIIFSVIVILILMWFIGMIIKGLLFIEKIVFWKLIQYNPIKKSVVNENVIIVNYDPQTKRTYSEKKTRPRQNTTQDITSKETSEPTTQRNFNPTNPTEVKKKRKARFSLI